MTADDRDLAYPNADTPGDAAWLRAVDRLIDLDRDLFRALLDEERRAAR